MEAFLVFSTNSVNYDNFYYLHDLKILQTLFGMLCYFILNDIKSVKEKQTLKVDEAEAAKLKYKEKHSINEVWRGFYDAKKGIS